MSRAGHSQDLRQEIADMIYHDLCAILPPGPPTVAMANKMADRIVSEVLEREA